MDGIGLLLLFIGFIAGGILFMLGFVYCKDNSKSKRRIHSQRMRSRRMRSRKIHCERRDLELQKEESIVFE